MCIGTFPALQGATRRLVLFQERWSSCSVIRMAQKRSGGRPSKGDRADIKTRIPTTSRDKLYEYAELVGESVTDLTAAQLVPRIASLDLEKARLGAAQESLEIDRKTA